MTLTMQDVDRYIQQALDGPLGAPLTAQDLANRSGRSLIGARSWHCQIRPYALVAFVANQDYATLPADFDRYVSIRRNSSILGSFRMTSQEHLNSLRSTWPQSGGIPMWGAIVHPAPCINAGPLPLRLELYPPPNQDLAAALSVQYRAGWTELVSDQSYVCIPFWMEDLYLEWVQEYALSLEERSKGTWSERRTRIQRGAAWMDAVTHDAQIQPYLGPMQGGAAWSEVEIIQNWDGTALVP